MADEDALYALPPDEFVAARDALARRLMDAGENDRAAALKKLRRPTVSAWAVNLGGRQAPELLEALTDLRGQLEKAQRQLLSGVRTTELAGLTRQRREQVDDLVEQAVAAAAEAGRDVSGHRDEVRATFEAALADPEAAALVRAGRLEKPLPAPAGFGTLAGLTAIPPPGAAAEPGEEDQGAAAPLDEARALRDRVAEAAERAVAQAHEAAREADRLRRDADRQADDAARRQRDAEAANAKAAQAAAAAGRARDAAAGADGRAQRARARADAALQQVEQADRLLESLTGE